MAVVVVGGGGDGVVFSYFLMSTGGCLGRCSSLCLAATGAWLTFEGCNCGFCAGLYPDRVRRNPRRGSPVSERAAGGRIGTFVGKLWCSGPSARDGPVQANDGTSNLRTPTTDPRRHTLATSRKGVSFPEQKVGDPVLGWQGTRCTAVPHLILNPRRETNGPTEVRDHRRPLPQRVINQT